MRQPGFIRAARFANFSMAAGTWPHHVHAVFGGMAGRALLENLDAMGWVSVGQDGSRTGGNK
jgi:hypothetical protein